jgi:hypothetical protein
MQYILQKYTLHTCYESTQSGPPVVCFHLYSQINQIFNQNKQGSQVKHLENSWILVMMGNSKLSSTWKGVLSLEKK